MELQRMMEGTRDALTVERVFGQPYEKNGLTVIPVANVRGGAGGGEGQREEEGEGSGGGFGLVARPAGVFVVAGDGVDWKPAVDVNRIVAGAQVVAVIALLTIRGILQWRAQK